MRVVGGEWRGRPLVAPEGRDTRPTTDRMRESIASSILSAQGLDIAGQSVLDGFAGSGAMGIELLSRGAAHCTFVEQDRRTLGIVRRNCRSVAAGARWSALSGDMRRLASQPIAGTPFDVVFLDPPYAMPATKVSTIVSSLREAGSLSEGALVVYERSAQAPTLEVSGMDLVRSKKHGITSVDLFRLGEDNG